MMTLTADRMGSDRYLQLVGRMSAEFEVKVYFVGGGLRDTLLARRIHDLDFALAGMPEEFPRTFAERVGGSFFWLDKERLQSRVVKPAEEGKLTFDFAPLRGEEIGDDLSLRDFTINAMALDLAGESRLIDPLAGADDLRDRKIRMCSGSAFDDDPLRLLRAVRLAAQLGFCIEEGTLERMKERALLLARAAAERVRDELFQILATPAAGASLRMFHDSGTITQLFPEVCRKNITESAVLGQIEKVDRIERVAREIPRAFPQFSEAIGGHLGREVEGGVDTLSLLKLAAFTGGMGNAEGWASRLKLGKGGRRVLSLLNRDMAPVIRVLSQGPGMRSVYRFFRDHEPAGVELLLLALAREELSEFLCSQFIEYFFTRYHSEAGELLLSGEEVMEVLGVGRGPAVGEAMERLRSAEFNGLVNTSEEAREFLLKKILTKEALML